MFRKLLGAATIALVLGGSSLAMAQTTDQCPCAITSGENGACLEYVSYQALPESGVNVKNDAFYFNQQITLNENSTVTVELKNATFVNPNSIALIVNNGTDDITVTPDTTSANTLTFTMPQDNVTLKELTELDG